MARGTVVTKHHHQRIKAKDLKHDAMRDAYDKVSDWVEANREQVKKIAAITLGVIVVGGLIYYLVVFRSSRAETAFANAYELYTAPVGDTNTTKSPVFFTKDEDKYKKAAEAFNQVASSYSWQYGDVATYFAGVSELKYDVKTGKQTLEGLSHKDSQTGKMAAFALAEQDKEDGDFDKAISIYQSLIKNPGDLPVTMVKLHLGDAYRLAGRKDDAVNTYFEIAKNGRKAAADAAAAKTKDPNSKAEGDPTPDITRQAVERLGQLDPSKVDELPEEPPAANQFGGF
ncbi:MAG TPA: hypothetical protein VFC63_25360 [Blastocatellia bacterium]|nr:hypothetical protein [Blastocatellia bacterium]